MAEKINEENVVGILAYGSLISDPGDEIERNRIGIIYNVDTPFSVEFARKSENRSNAPTLIPFKGGKSVKGQVFVMNLCEDEAKNVLFRREIDKVGKLRHTYKRKSSLKLPGHVYVESFTDRKKWPKLILATSISGNMKFEKIKGNEDSYAERLAYNAIISVSNAKPSRDGISYLNDAIGNGIDTFLSEKYKNRILELTYSQCLCQALVRCQAFFWGNELKDVRKNFNEDLKDIEKEDLNEDLQVKKVNEKLASVFEVFAKI